MEVFIGHQQVLIIIFLWLMVLYARYGQILSFTKANLAGYLWAVRAEHPAKLTVQKTGQKVSYHAGDDGNLKRGFSLTRFVDHGDGTVTDRVTRLVWLKDISCLNINLN